MPPSAVETLRKQLREKFPQAHVALPEAARNVPEKKPFRTGEFPAGRISELIPSGHSSGLLLVIAGLLGDPEEPSPHPELVLVDGADAFDPESFSGTACSKMLWVRCSSAMEMIRAADLLALDGNVPLVLLDATGLGRKELAALPASVWWRLNRTIGRTGGRLVVMSPFPLVPCASLRLSLSANLSLADFDHSRAELLGRLHAAPERLRHAT